MGPVESDIEKRAYLLCHKTALHNIESQIIMPPASHQIFIF
jgi:hypothetical protein